MPSADELLHQKRRDAADEAQRIADHKRQQARAEASRAAAILQRLRDNPDFQWFAETHLAPLVTKEHDDAMDIRRSAHDRDLSAHRHALAVDLRDLLQIELETALAKAQALL